MTVQLEEKPGVAIAAAPAENPAAASKPRAGVDELRCSREIRILIVDDDVPTCKVVEAALQGHGFNITSVSDPEKVLAVLQGPPVVEYHLILLDYVLPGLESDQAFGWIREFQPDASVIVLTGYPSIDSALSCLRARTFDYITKPFQFGQLREVVLRCLKSMGLLRMSEEALRESLGASIRERRKSMGLTLAQMAAKTEISLGYLSQIELGKNSASIETLYRISLALGVKLSELFTAVQQSR